MMLMKMKTLLLPVSHQISLTRSPPTRSADDQGEGFLLHSYDRTLVIKQITSEDVADMHNVLSEYHQVSRRRRGLPVWTFPAAVGGRSRPKWGGTVRVSRHAAPLTGFPC